MNFREFIDKSFWTLLLGICGFGVHFLGNMSSQIAHLNEQIAVVVSHIAATDDQVKLHEHRLEVLEQLQVTPSTTTPSPRRR